MNKSEALVVLHEIYDALRESVIMSSVSLDSYKILSVHGDFCEIKIKCELDNHSRYALNGVLKKHDLAMNEQNGYIILHSLETVITGVHP